MTGSRPDIDVAGLERALRGSVSGDVRFDAGSRALYATDASNYRQVPIGLVLPKTADDVVATLKACRQFGAPITNRGGGTSLAGQCCNVAVVIDFSRHMNRVLEIDPEARTAWVEPGCVNDDLRDAAEKHHLTFAPDPSTHNHNTVGGMVGNNSCGVHSVMGGRTSDNVEALEIATADGVVMTVGETSDEIFAAITAGEGRKAEIYAGLKAIRDRYADLIRRRYPDIPRRVSGYNLDDLLPERGFHVARALVGSEGTCVTVLKIKVRLVPSPPVRRLVVFGFDGRFKNADAVPAVMRHDITACEGMDEKLVRFMIEKGLHPEDVELLPKGKSWLLVEVGGGTVQEAEDKAKALIDEIGQAGTDGLVSSKLFAKGWEAGKIWEVRKAGLGATSHIDTMGESHPGWEDAAVSPDRVGDYLRDFRGLLDKYGYDCALYGHYGQGCVHCRINFRLKTRHGLRNWMQFLEEAADLVVSYNGSLSGEHGDGQARAALLERMYGPELMEAFSRFKRLWDPDGRMNPGKVVDAYPPDSNLRMGPDYAPPVVPTAMTFLEDESSFAKLSTRCVGVGECRKHSAGTMCPSYMATREEAYSTRGRSRLLFEMLRGEVITDGFRSAPVRDALDFCLACKACKHECPVNVDMASYKAEFMHRHYKRRLRPRDAYALGLVHWAARAASFAPGLANTLTHREPFAGIAKWAAGIHGERDVPLFAEETFRSWFARHQPRGAGIGGSGGSDGRTLTHADVPRYRGESFTVEGDHAATRPRLNPLAAEPPRHGRRVLLWPDTFNDHFTPEPLKAATEFLEAAGYSVELPPRVLCCGRPLYAVGMLSLARRLWRRTLETLQPYIRDDVPVVGVEPACVSAFRDELLRIFPRSEDAHRLSERTYILSEFLELQDIPVPEIGGRALVHGHCHHKAVIQMDAEVAVLKRTGLDFEILDVGCCGLAGDYGFRRQTHGVSVAIAERALLPRLRETGPGVPFVTNGFSCREQVRQLLGRSAVTLPELLRDGLNGGVTPP